MKKRLIDISIITVGIAFLCWYLPIAFYNVFACDDYWFGTNVRNNGLWGNVLFYYINWEGSYTHTFLASWPLVFHYERMPFIGNMVSLLLIYSSLCFFLKTFTNMTVRRCLMFSSYFLAFAYLCTKGNSEIRFWICANVTYVSEVSFMLLMCSLYHSLQLKATHVKWLLMFVIAFLVGGSKLTVIIYTFSGLVIHDVLFKKEINRITLVVFFLISIFVVINIASPGNYIRLDAELIPKEEKDQMTIYESIVYRFLEMKSYLLNALFLLPIAFQWDCKCKFCKKHVWLVIVIAFVTFVLDSVVMYLCFNDSGPLRVYFVAEVFVAILILFLLNSFYSMVLNKYISSEIISIVFALMVAISNASMTSKVPASMEFSKLARERDKYVASYFADDTIKITRLPESHLMLSYFANDEIWLEHIYLPYFQKKNKVILIDEPKTDEI